MELKFEKETISKLDEQQMSEVNGGSSYPCWGYRIVTLTVATYGYGNDLTWWNCPGGGDGGDGTPASQQNTCDICIA